MSAWDYLADPINFRYKSFFVRNGHVIGVVLYVCICNISVSTIVPHGRIDRRYTTGEKSIFLLQ